MKRFSIPAWIFLGIVSLFITITVFSFIFLVTESISNGSDTIRDALILVLDTSSCVVSSVFGFLFSIPALIISINWNARAKGPQKTEAQVALSLALFFIVFIIFLFVMMTVLN